MRTTDTWTRNPFNFQLFDLQGVRLTVNGEEMPYSALDLTGGKKIDGYNTLFSGSGEMNCGMVWILTERIGNRDTVCSVSI